MSPSPDRSGSARVPSPRRTRDQRTRTARAPHAPKAATPSVRPAPASPTPTAAPRAVLDPVTVSPPARFGAVLVLAGILLWIASELTVFVEVSRGPVQPQLTVFSIAAYAVLLAIGGGAAVLLAAGRGGRALIAALAPIVLLAPGHLALSYYAGHDGGAGSHHVVEYYFGIGQYVGGLQPRTGWWLALAAASALIIGGLLLALAWRGTQGRPGALPGRRHRQVVGTAAITIAAIAAAHLIAPALGVRRQYVDPSGLVLTEDVPLIHTELGLLGVGRLGGVLLLLGWLAIAALIAGLGTRAALLGALVGTTTAVLVTALMLLRDIASGPDLAIGPRVVILLLAAAALAAATWWSAAARHFPATGDRL